MAINHATFTVGTTPTLIATIAAGNPLTSVVVSNSDNGSIFIGDATVAKTGQSLGLKVGANVNTQVWLNAGDTLYAISSAGTSAYAVGVLYSEVV